MNNGGVGLRPTNLKYSRSECLNNYSLKRPVPAFSARTGLKHDKECQGRLLFTLIIQPEMRFYCTSGFIFLLSYSLIKRMSRADLSMLLKITTPNIPTQIYSPAAT